MPELVLLSHETELRRATNTGQLVRAVAELAANSALEATSEQWRCRQISWQRRVPDADLLLAIKCQPYVLLYPSPQARQLRFDQPLWPQQITAAERPAGVILLDATWQQAQKMYNQSPYLQQLPHWQAVAAYQSVFNLRRNQRAGAWCTAETVALLWQAWGASAPAEALWQAFRQFNQRGHSGVDSPL